MGTLRLHLVTEAAVQPFSRSINHFISQSVLVS